VVFDSERRIVVAELDKEPGRAARLGVAPGRYVLKKREAEQLRLQRLRLRAGGVWVVEPGAMEQVAFADDYAKGVVVTAEQVIAPLGVRLSAVVGPQVFLSAPVREQYVPTLVCCSCDWISIA